MHLHWQRFLEQVSFFLYILVCFSHLACGADRKEKVWVRWAAPLEFESILSLTETTDWVLCDTCRDPQGGYIFGGQCLSIFRNKKLAPYQNVRAGAPVCESFLLAWLNYVCHQNFSSGWELWGLISLTSSFLRRASGGYQAREKMLNITSWRNANQNEQWGIPHQSVWPASKNLQIIGVPVAD